MSTNKFQAFKKRQASKPISFSPNSEDRKKIIELAAVYETSVSSIVAYIVKEFFKDKQESK